MLLGYTLLLETIMIYINLEINWLLHTPSLRIKIPLLLKQSLWSLNADCIIKGAVAWWAKLHQNSCSGISKLHCGYYVLMWVVQKCPEFCREWVLFVQNHKFSHHSIPFSSFNYHIPVKISFILRIDRSLEYSVTSVLPAQRNDWRQWRGHSFIANYAHQ